MTSAQVVETSVTTTHNSSSQNCSHPNDQTTLSKFPPRSNYLRCYTQTCIRRSPFRSVAFDRNYVQGFIFIFGCFSSQSVDATLYLIQSVAEYVEPTEESFIPAILSLLPRLPSHSYVSQTALLMVGMCG